MWGQAVIVSKLDTFLDEDWTVFSPRASTSKLIETEDNKLTTGTTEQACGQKLYRYMLQNISTPEIQLITYSYKTTLHILK